MGILGDLLAFLIQSLADFHDILQNEALQVMNPQCFRERSGRRADLNPD